MRHIYVLKLFIMLEISWITVIYKRIGKFWYITQSELNSCKMEIFLLIFFRGGTFAFAHLFLQISDSHISNDFFLGWYCLRNRNKANKWLEKHVLLFLRQKTSNLIFAAAQISLIMSQQIQSVIFHTKLIQNALWYQITWSKWMLCNILEYCSQTLDIHGQRVLQLILFLFMTL
jgi:hypothetical protein